MKISSKAIPFLVPAILLFLGMLLSFSEFFIHAPTYIQAVFTTVKHPVKPDFSATDRLLKAVVIKGLIDYDKVKSTPLLNQALDELAAESPDHFEKKDDVLAYWINAHNVLSIKIQAGNYGDKSAPLRSPEFRTRRFVVAGQPTSVEQIWVDKLTPLFLPPQRTKGADPRAFLLLCRCSMGYPPMVDHAVTAETLSHDMAENTEKFLHDDGNVYYSREKDLLVISLLFRWHANIFSHDTASPFIFVLDQIDPDIEEEPAFDYASQFDWRINAYRK